MFSIVRVLWFGAALVVPVVLFGCPPEGGNVPPGTGGGGGSGGETTVAALCDRLDECNELVGLSAVECTDVTNFCLDQSFPTQSLKDDWALFVEDCLDFATCGVFVDCALDVAEATGCPSFYAEPVDLQETIEELCGELDFCGSLGENTIPQCIDSTYQCLDLEYPMTTDEWVDAAQNCYDTTPDCLDYVNCLIDDADCPYFDGAGGGGGAGGGEGGASGEGGTGGIGGTPDVPATVAGLCRGLADACGLIELSVLECIDVTNLCLDENFPTQSLQEDWAVLVESCLQLETCDDFYNCWLEVPFC